MDAINIDVTTRLLEANVIQVGECDVAAHQNELLAPEVIKGDAAVRGIRQVAQEACNTVRHLVGEKHTSVSLTAINYSIIMEGNSNDAVVCCFHCNTCYIANYRIY